MFTGIICVYLNTGGRTRIAAGLAVTGIMLDIIIGTGLAYNV
jgi:hypothetical protein